MTLMRAAAVNGVVLTYDTDDVEKLHIETPNDVKDVTPPFARYRTCELGQAHLVLRVDFKEGKRPLWVTQADAALPDLRMGGDILTAALTAEDVPAELAARIWNRFFFGVPDGPNAAPRRFDHDPVDCPVRVEITAIRDAEPQFIHGNRCYDAAPRVLPPEEQVAQMRAQFDSALAQDDPGWPLPHEQPEDRRDD